MKEKLKINIYRKAPEYKLFWGFSISTNFYFLM
jgi:hypothetical protein